MVWNHQLTTSFRPGYPEPGLISTSKTGTAQHWQSPGVTLLITSPSSSYYDPKFKLNWINLQYQIKTGTECVGRIKTCDISVLPNLLLISVHGASCSWCSISQSLQPPNQVLRRVGCEAHYYSGLLGLFLPPHLSMFPFKMSCMPWTLVPQPILNGL